MMRLRDLSKNQLFEQMTSQVYAKKEEAKNYTFVDLFSYAFHSNLLHFLLSQISSLGFAVFSSASGSLRRSKCWAAIGGDGGRGWPSERDSGEGLWLWFVGTVEGKLKKEDLSATRSLVRTTLLRLTVMRMVLRGKMEACTRKGSLIFSQNRGAAKRGMKEIRGRQLHQNNMPSSPSSSSSREKASVEGENEHRPKLAWPSLLLSPEAATIG
ncbi:LOW QUALITY PROTEIN: hypothetical protein NC653_007911 [Populus alba x Populus x berolinensis]|uniref:Uncharacterized protein n=1 Tax=Populus alba x Populus x berolinensis TaxID=444605 RepID=A0AAD6R697_9ROSI|nr:LOW QUALITY PROTEIN: hypothetical protein NC653_007911 [Populus alba x Populus x berolinensis]